MSTKQTVYKAGNELNGVVAEKLMGYERIHLSNQACILDSARKKGIDVFFKDGEMKFCACHNVFRWSDNAEKMWEVVWAMAERGFEMELTVNPEDLPLGREPHVSVRFMDEKRKSHLHEAMYMWDPAYAVCIAALRAIGEDVSVHEDMMVRV